MLVLVEVDPSENFLVTTVVMTFLVPPGPLLVLVDVLVEVLTTLFPEDRSIRFRSSSIEF